MIRDEKTLINETEPIPELKIRAQTVEEELKEVQLTLNRLEIYDKLNLVPKLPNDPELRKPFTDGDREAKLKLLQAEYDPKTYEAGINQVEAYRVQIESVFPKFIEVQQKWGFKIFSEYEILLTKYGVGGNYHDVGSKGMIRTRVNEDGTFVRKHPMHTVIHEMIHLGVDDGIVKKYHLNQAEKERMVDFMCVALFSDLMPDYQIQRTGDPRIEPFVNAQTVENLPEAIQRYVETYPRV